LRQQVRPASPRSSESIAAISGSESEKWKRRVFSVARASRFAFGNGDEA